MHHLNKNFHSKKSDQASLSATFQKEDSWQLENTLPPCHMQQQLPTQMRTRTAIKSVPKKDKLNMGIQPDIPKWTLCQQKYIGPIHDVLEFISISCSNMLYTVLFIYLFIYLFNLFIYLLFIYKFYLFIYL